MPRARRATRADAPQFFRRLSPLFIKSSITTIRLPSHVRDNDSRDYSVRSSGEIALYLTYAALRNQCELFVVCVVDEDSSFAMEIFDDAIDWRYHLSFSCDSFHCLQAAMET